MFNQSESSSPFIGQIVDYYPSNNQRAAAIISEVHPISEGDRPKVDLFVFGKDFEQLTEINPVVSDGGDQVELKEKWAFPHEFMLEQSDDFNEETSPGSQTNRFVGYVGMVA